MIAVATGASGPEAVRGCKVDLVLLDLGVPDLPGPARPKGHRAHGG